MNRLAVRRSEMRLEALLLVCVSMRGVRAAV